MRFFAVLWLQGDDCSEYGLPPNSLDPSVTWNDIYWLQSLTRLPIIIKGILTKEDAELAVRHGAQGIIVSNHGGRQLDGGPATVSVKIDVPRVLYVHLCCPGYLYTRLCIYASGRLVCLLHGCGCVRMYFSFKMVRCMPWHGLPTQVFSQCLGSTELTLLKQNYWPT